MASFLTRASSISSISTSLAWWIRPSNQLVFYLTNKHHIFTWVSIFNLYAGGHMSHIHAFTHAYLGMPKLVSNRCPLEVRMWRNVYWRIRSSKLEILTHFGWSQTMSLDLYIRLSWRTGHFKCSFHGHSSNLRTLEHIIFLSIQSKLLMQWSICLFSCQQFSSYSSLSSRSDGTYVFFTV